MKPLLSLLLITISISFCSAQKFKLDTIYTPAHGANKNVAVIYFGGSLGGIPNYNFNTKTLPALGYPTLGVGYFKTPNTPNELVCLPLEYWEQVFNDFCNRPEIKGKKIVLDGISRGAELALLLGSMFDEVNGVIAIAPSSVVWQGLTEKDTVDSSYTYKGEQIPFLPFYHPYDYSTVKNGEYMVAQLLAFTQKSEVGNASIKVENTNGPILLFSGEVDHMWPATFMGELIIQRLKEHNFPYEYHHYHYKNVSHSFNYNDEDPRGTPEAIHAANEDFKIKYLEFLEKLNTH